MLKRPRSMSIFNRTIPFNYGGPSAIMHQLQQAKKQRVGGSFSYTRTGSSNRTRGVVTTAQRDYNLQYRKKSASKKIKKRSRKSYKRFIKQSLKLVGTNTVVFNDTLTASTSAALPQGYMTFTVGSTNGTNNSYDEGNGDLNTLISNDTRISSSGKLCLKSSAGDYTIRNTGTTAPLEVDVYEIVYYDTTKEANWAGIYSSAATNTPPIGAAASLSLNNRGVQLFDFPDMMKRGVSVLKKTKIFLPVGNTATYRLKCKSNQWITPANDISDNSGYVKRNFTRSLVCVFKPVVGSGDVGTLAIACTRRYVYKIFEDDRDCDALL